MKLEPIRLEGRAASQRVLRNQNRARCLPPMPSHQSTAFDLLARMGLASFHTGMTLWYRLPILMAAGTRGADVPELNRMITEKVAAASEGFADAHAEMLRLTTAALMGKLEFSDVSGAGTALANAALSPSLHAVKRNSQRLSRKHRSS